MPTTPAPEAKNFAPMPLTELLPQGVARGDHAGQLPSSWTYKVTNWIRVNLYRPVLRIARRILGGTVLLREPVSAEDTSVEAQNYKLLHPAETIDLGDPATDLFLANCQYVVNGQLRRAGVFVCELENAKIYPKIGLVFDRRWSPILDSIFDLGRYYNFRRQLRPREIVRREGVSSSVQHIFSNNHWHWTVDSLAQVWSLEQYMQGKPLALLMPDSLPVHQREHLGMLLPGHFTVEYIAAETYVECERFVLPSYVSGRADAYLPKAYWAFLRERVFAKLNVSKPTEAGGRYYISRSRAAHRRVTNEAEVLGVLEPLGFQLVWMEDYPFAEQVRMMRGAECVVSPHGAGLGCMVYGDALKVGVLYPEARPAGYFYTMARALGHQHYQTNSDVLEDDDFIVDLQQLESMVVSMDLAQ